MIFVCRHSLIEEECYAGTADVSKQQLFSQKCKHCCNWAVKVMIVVCAFNTRKQTTFLLRIDVRPIVLPVLAYPNLPACLDFQSLAKLWLWPTHKQKINIKDQLLQQQWCGFWLQVSQHLDFFNLSTTSTGKKSSAPFILARCQNSTSDEEIWKAWVDF